MRKRGSTEGREGGALIFEPILRAVAEAVRLSVIGHRFFPRMARINTDKTIR